MDSASIRAELNAKAEDISRRLDAIQGEVSTAGEAVKEAVRSKPALAIGGAIAAGLLVGLMFGGSRAGKRSTFSGRQEELIREYIEAIAEDVRRTTRKGMDAAGAVREALRDRVPVIFYSGTGEEKPQGLLREGFDVVYKTALGFAVKYAVDFATDRLNLHELAEAIESGEGSDAAAPVAAIVSE